MDHLPLLFIASDTCFAIHVLHLKLLIFIQTADSNKYVIHVTLMISIQMYIYPVHFKFSSYEIYDFSTDGLVNFKYIYLWMISIHCQTAQYVKHSTLMIVIQITQSIHTLVKDVLSLTDTGRSSEVMTFVVILGRCLPLIQQYRYMLEYFLLQCLAENRVTGKLLSVLLGVFTELAAKVRAGIYL